MDRDLRNKTIVVTGGAMGLGHEIAENFLKKNAKVVIILDIDENLGTEVVKELTTKYGNSKAVFYKCDVTTDLEVVYKKIIDTFGTVDVLVNNAGIFNDVHWTRTIDINVTALMEWTFKFWDHMRKDKSGKGGTIINLASIYGYRISPYVPAYIASKFAVLGFTKSIGHSHNFSRFGVRVVAICPGFTETSLVIDIQTWIPELMEICNVETKKEIWQKPSDVGKAAVDVFESAESGTAWLIEGGKPIKQVL